MVSVMKELSSYPMLGLHYIISKIDGIVNGTSDQLDKSFAQIVPARDYCHSKVTSTNNTVSVRDQHFNRNVAKLISKWTGRIWQIHSSDSNIGSSLSEEDVVNQQNEIKTMKNHPKVKKILEAFPGLSIHSITDITDTVDETIDEFNSENKKEL